jgi:outer membrane cobalamin receptor
VLGQRLIRRPVHAARVELARAITSRGDVTLGAAYTGRTDDRNFSAFPAAPVVLNARTLVDGAVNVRLSDESAGVPLRARLRVENLAGTRYQGIFGYQAPGRVVRLGLTLGQP